jgi:hypothetical protein
MKNKRLTLTFILISLTGFLHCAELTDFSFESGFGFLNGMIIENVWRAKVINSGQRQTFSPTTRLSRLDWQLENTPAFFLKPGASLTIIL